MTGASLDARVRIGRADGFVLDVEIAVAAGETVAVMGPSGAGKSTLLGAIAGIERLDAGHVRIDDHRVADAGLHVPPARRGAALLGQEPLLFPHLSARDNVAFALRSRGVGLGEARRRAEGWLVRLGLGPFVRRRPSELSGGQQQRAALARALAAEPRVVLLDEPLTGLDVETASEIRGVLREQLAAVGATSIVVTHSAVDAAALADRLIVIERGTFTQSGSVADVLRAPATPFVAAVAGVNRIEGTVRGGVWADAAGGALRVVLADAPDDGAAVAVLRPAAVHLDAVEPDVGADAGDGPFPHAMGDVCWRARVTRIEPTPFGAFVHTSPPAVAVEVGVERLADLALTAGAQVYLRVARGDVRIVARRTLAP